MPFDDGDRSSEPRPPSGGDGEYGESLILEIRAAADAAVSQLRKVAATASTEVRISVASVIWMACAMMLSVALLIVAWSCVVGIGVWLAVDAGWSIGAALAAAAAANLLAAVICRSWYVKLSRDIGFARTLGLLFGVLGNDHVFSQIAAFFSRVGTNNSEDFGLFGKTAKSAMFFLGAGEHLPALHRLTKIPGVDLYAAQELLSEIGPRAAAFASAEQFASWVGVCPGSQESPGSVRGPRTTTAFARLRNGSRAASRPG